ncbi:hypothetical protein LDENG_00095280 [Lucifuga dentata]|nr:hypothetical protein LDENG_00095280 [Lucifuga dentata]
MAEGVNENVDTTVDDDYERDDDPEILEEIEKYAKMSPEESKATARKQLDELENVTLNIAVTGESGVGKSTFINALRGLEDGDEGAAQTGVTETTMEAIPYCHPTFPSVYFWDLPGIGTPKFKAKNYLKDVQFSTYDFFIIIGSNRFKENDIMLAKEVKKINKELYFVRSKIDQDIQGESQKKNFDEETVLSEIRLSCRENLKEIGNPEVFLISSFDIAKYDFQKLLDSLKDNLSEQKWAALIQSLPVTSVSMIEKKAKQLKTATVAVAAASATTASVPLLLTCETLIMQQFFKSVLVSFGLDDKSLERLGERVNKSKTELKSEMKSCFASGVNKTTILNLIYTRAHNAKIIQAILMTTVPIGAAGMALILNMQLLEYGIDELAKDAKALLHVAGLS